MVDFVKQAISREAYREIPEDEEEGNDVNWGWLHLNQLDCNNASNHEEDTEGCKAHVGIDHSLTLHAREL